jgi:hypothetical protein
MARTRAVDDVMLDNPKGSAGRGQAPLDNAPPLLHHTRLTALSSYWQLRTSS